MCPQPVDKLRILYEVTKGILLPNEEDEEVLEKNIPDKDIKLHDKEISTTPEDDLVLPSPSYRILIIEMEERFDNSTNSSNTKRSYDDTTAIREYKLEEESCRLLFQRQIKTEKKKRE